MIPVDASPDSSLGQRLGFVLLCLFALAGYANEFALRIFHTKAYLSTILWVLLPLALAASGNIFRSLRDSIGRLWLVFLVLICFAVPFSVWRGGSVALLAGYVPRDWVQMLYTVGFLVSVGHLRRFMTFLIAADFLLLADALWFGSASSGRLEIPDSIFFANANDLSLQLLIAITQFSFLLFLPRWWQRWLGIAAIATALIESFRTGGRGAFVAVLALGIGSFLVSKHRVRFALIGSPILAAAVYASPQSALHRMTLFSTENGSDTAIDQAATSSERQRMDLLLQSVEYALDNPVFGVGPGQFAVVVFGDSAKSGRAAPWLGTHNSYTQVASECGIPALVIYVGVILLTLRSNLRIYRRTAASSGGGDQNALAFCLFGSTLVYAICTFFFHIAYSSYLPLIAGMSLALKLAPPESSES